MNNTTTLAIVAVLTAATLVVGGTLGATTSVFAYQKKGESGSKNGNTVTIQKCKQDATQSGFDNNQAQECENLICTHPGSNATCVSESEGAAVSNQTGGGGGGGGACAEGQVRVTVDGISICATLPVRGVCPDPLIRVHLDGIDVCLEQISSG